METAHESEGRRIKLVIQKIWGYLCIEAIWIPARGSGCGSSEADRKKSCTSGVQGVCCRGVPVVGVAVTQGGVDTRCKKKKTKIRVGNEEGNKASSVKTMQRSPAEQPARGRLFVSGSECFDGTWRSLKNAASYEVTSKTWGAGSADSLRRRGAVGRGRSRRSDGKKRGGDTGKVGLGLC